MRINRTNPEQPAAQPVQSHAPIKAQTEVNGFEPTEQEIPKENQKKPPKAAKPPKPKKEKPAGPLPLGRNCGTLGRKRGGEYVWRSARGP